MIHLAVTIVYNPKKWMFGFFIQDNPEYGHNIGILFGVINFNITLGE